MGLSAYSHDKSVRLEARLSLEQKKLIQRAADLQGQSLTDFIVSSLQDDARRIIKEHELLTLTAEDSSQFVNALLNPSKPNQALKNAANKYRKFMDSDDE